jgi:hypothetical protein
MARKCRADSVCAIAGDERDAAVFEYVTLRIERAPDSAAALRKLPRGLQILYLSTLIEWEVMNGGFPQFFWNRSDFADMAVDALTELGAEEAATILRSVNDIANREAELREQLRQEQQFESLSNYAGQSGLAVFGSPFCNLAQQFSELRNTYLKKHRDQFAAADAGFQPHIYARMPEAR